MSSEPQPVCPVDPIIAGTKAEPRLKGQNGRILEMLRLARVVSNSSLVAIAYKYSSRLADLRGAGYMIDKIKYPDSEARGVYGYTLWGWSPYSKLEMLPAVATIVEEVEDVWREVGSWPKCPRYDHLMNKLAEITLRADLVENRRRLAVAQAKGIGNRVIECTHTTVHPRACCVSAKTQQGWWMRAYGLSVGEAWSSLTVPVRDYWEEELPVLEGFE